FREEFPNNNNLEAKLRQILQQLGEREEITFLGDGVYRIDALDIDTETSGDEPNTPEYTAETYKTTVDARSLPAAFRIDVLDQYDHTCPVSGVDHDRLLDVAHILPWSDFDESRADLRNVLLLSKTHHAAFDAGLFTLDTSFRLRINPEFETESDLLRQTLLDRASERVDLPMDTSEMDSYLTEHNRRLDWWTR
ncbi:MAG TPA: HNH endonuclease, partial [Halococcus sp.]|nr:HNH endonuclease [Halococcus sp.]